jgi:hypothetical protein
MRISSLALASILFLSIGNIRAAEDFREPRSATLLNARPAILEMMRKNGVREEGLVSQREKWKLEDSVGGIGTWTQWTNYYHATVFDPPISFRRAEAFSYSYGEPVAAFRSYLRAMWVGDAQELLNHADSSGVAHHKQMGVDPSARRATYDITNQFRHVTILLVATTKFEDQDYALILWRAENESEPMAGRIALQTTIFVRSQSGYLMSRNLRDGYFGRVTTIAGARDGMWKYPDFVALMLKSQFPPSFSKFGDDR